MKVETIRIQDIEDPKLSIVIPIGNRYGSRVINTMKGIEQQTISNIEVIVVDYGSELMCHKKLMENLTPFDCTIYSYPTTDVWSLTISRNIGIRRAHGKYIATLDGDCIPERNVARLTLDALEGNPRAFMIRQPIFMDKFFCFLFNLSLPEDYSLLAEAPGRYIQPSLGAYMATAKEWWFKVRGFDERMKGWGSDDWDIWQRALRDGRLCKKFGPPTEVGLPTTQPSLLRTQTEIYHQWHPETWLMEIIGEKKFNEHRRHNQEIRSEKTIVRNDEGWGMFDG